MIISKYSKLFTKQVLLKEYQNNSVCNIALKYNIPNSSMYRIFKKFDIIRRATNAGGIFSPNYKHGRCIKNLKKCIDCEKILSVNPNAHRCLSCLAQHKKQDKNYINKVRKITLNGWKFNNYAKKLCSKRIMYKTTNMRSSYEVSYAKWLDKNHIKWLYEPKTFDLGNTTYTPDFYLPETDEYIEIKGYWRNGNFYKKIKLFRNDYKLRVLYKRNLHKIGVL